MLVAALERDDDCRAAFFSRLKRLIYAGASLPLDIWDRLQALALRTRGRQIDFGAPLVDDLYDAHPSADVYAVTSCGAHQ
ncbi:MAG: hypothetical protein DCF31_00420 [Alphaproteobacteria bacterium]|nr:MAG: hypothetical protein DCF31_00420 [Alphaproteobacteria bacterium]